MGEKILGMCTRCADTKKRTIRLKEIVRLIIKSAVETGTPFAFNRDTVNPCQSESTQGHDLLF